jgi:hypothetical protein
LPMVGVVMAANWGWSVRAWRASMWRAHKPWSLAWQVIVWLPGHLMWQVVPSKWIWHPAWVNGVTPMRLVPSSGKTCTVLASRGIPGSGSSAVWVDVMICWLATRTEIGVVVGWRLGRLGVRAE